MCRAGTLVKDVCHNVEVILDRGLLECMHVVLGVRVVRGGHLGFGWAAGSRAGCIVVSKDMSVVSAVSC